MVRSAIPSLPLDELDLLIVENVGNLVCPAEFRIGEDARVMVCSVTEGEDKPLKYPLMFRTCELVLVNKIDLLPHLEFDLDRLLYNLDQVHPDVERMLVSARSGEGIDAWREWLVGVAQRRAPGGACVTRGARGRRLRAARAAAPRAHAVQRAVLRGRGRAARAAVPQDGRAVRARRQAGRVRPLARRTLRRAARGGRVRAPGDRGQARAAGDRAGGGGGRPRGAGRAWCSEPRTSRSRSGSRSRTGRRPARWRSRGARGCLTIAFAPAGAEWELEPPSADPYVRQELVETLYHVLWELVHVFFEHRGLLEGRDQRRLHDAGASSFLYPFLAEREDALAPVLEDVRRSALMKSEEVGALRAQTLTDNHDVLIDAAGRIRASFERGGQLLALGNGGSATDAMDASRTSARPSGGSPGRRIDLTQDSGIITAIANDVGPELIFARQVIAYGRAGDVLLALSTSGNSRNVIEALAEARRRELVTDRAGRLRRRAGGRRIARRPRRGDPLGAHSEDPGGAGERLPRPQAAGRMSATAGPVRRRRVARRCGCGYRARSRASASGPTSTASPQELSLGGFVLNDSHGVVIEVEGGERAVRRLLARLEPEAPPLAVLERVSTEPLPPTGERGFRIRESPRGGVADAPVTRRHRDL